jgi:hypothetical protein
MGDDQYKAATNPNATRYPTSSTGGHETHKLWLHIVLFNVGVFLQQVFPFLHCILQMQ